MEIFGLDRGQHHAASRVAGLFELFANLSDSLL